MSELTEKYTQRYEVALKPAAEALEGFIKDILKGVKRIDRVVTRAKCVGSFIKKSENLDESGKKKYDDPLTEIQDQIGARIVTFYVSDVPRISEVVEKYFKPIENKDYVPDRESEFGYFGKHYIFLIPSDVIQPKWPKEHRPRVFELQIKTLFQHAWSQANHDLGYKEMVDFLSTEQKRKIAFTSAQSWGADHIFDELFKAVSQKKGDE